MHSAILAAAVSLLTLMATPAGAQSSTDVGGTSCAEFLRARASDNLHRQASNWLYGYASGLYAGLKAGKHPAVMNLSNEQLLKSATDYCRANPASTLASAASEWVPPPPPEPEPPPPPPKRDFFDFLGTKPTLPGGRQ